MLDKDRLNHSFAVANKMIDLYDNVLWGRNDTDLFVNEKLRYG